MAVLKWIAIVVVLLVLLTVGFGLALSNEYALERSVVVEASPAQVHALVGDLARWEEWTPWKDEDPTVTTTLGDQTTGVGARQTWTDQSGGGWLAFTRCDVETGVAYDMAFVWGEGEESEEMPATGALDYEVVEGGTKVTWSMSGAVDMPVLGGYMAKMLPASIEPMFDNGLNKLKLAAEAEPAAPAAEPAAAEGE